ncbi:MAG TPA: hypothetical protein VNR66_05040, partial [Solirubrobacteraceae bacterium]|nr:hypothetical protein [Solirubrobacteraceae bacterium]
MRELQAGLTLTPAGTGGGVPEADPAVPEELRFFEQMRVWMQAFPPAPRDAEYQQRFAPLGLWAAESPYTNPDPELA